jgi:hypothetical protein
VAPSATLAASDVPGGVTIAIKSKRLDDVDSLRQAVRERARSFEAPVVRP